MPFRPEKLERDRSWCARFCKREKGSRVLDLGSVLKIPEYHTNVLCRYVPMFGDTDYDPSLAFSGAVPLEEQLEALGKAVRIRSRPARFA